MTDLFAHYQPQKAPKPNHGVTNNAAFLADLADNIPTDELRNRYKAGNYGKLRPEYIRGWLKLSGRDTNDG